MLLIKKINKVTIKEGGHINIFLIEAIDKKNQLKIFDKEIVDKIVINTLVNRLP